MYQTLKSTSDASSSNNLSTRNGFMMEPFDKGYPIYTCHYRRQDDPFNYVGSAFTTGSLYIVYVRTSRFTAIVVCANFCLTLICLNLANFIRISGKKSYPLPTAICLSRPSAKIWLVFDNSTCIPPRRSSCARSRHKRLVYGYLPGIHAHTHILWGR